MVFISERVDALFGSGLLFIPTRAAKGCIELVFVEGLFEAFCFHHIGMFLAAVGEGTNARIDAILIDVNQ